ncbi:MAG: pyridoxamine 5'-phosphate oxidase family protein [Negativicutes bacterium]|nr:pyridoxamine 5'-phosphate oxidase family protein [Negativicutes bacterium]
MYEQEVINLVKNNTAFMGTVDGHRPRVRPMKPYVDEAGHIWLISAAKTKKVAEIEENPRVELCVQGQGEFVQIFGRLKPVKPEAELLKTIFAALPAMTNYFSGPDDPNVVIYRMTVHEVFYANQQHVLTTNVNLDTEPDWDREVSLCPGGFCLD